MYTWSGRFVVEPFTASPIVAMVASAAAGMGSEFTRQERTLPSFSFRYLKLSHQLVVEIDVLQPRLPHIDDAFHAGEEYS